MAYKCGICGTNDVAHMGDVCELCAIGSDPYASAIQGNDQSMLSNNFGAVSVSDSSPVANRRRSRKVLINGGDSPDNLDPYGNSMSPQKRVQVYQAGQVPQATPTVSTSSIPVMAVNDTHHNDSLTYGIIKNVTTDAPRASVLRKWCRSLFMGIPFSLDNQITMFQVFPDYTGSSLNAMGNACDQVIVYGKLKSGAIAENNEVEIFGYRDTNNYIVANKIRNKASGTVVRPERTISPALVWFFTACVIVLIGIAVSILGTVGLVWSAVILLCLTNLPLVFKILGIILGSLFSFGRRRFR